jgi:hypothetical protein
MKGWCLRTLSFIPENAFVMEYVGERVSHETRDERILDDPNVEIYIMGTPPPAPPVPPCACRGARASAVSPRVCARAAGIALALAWRCRRVGPPAEAGVGSRVVTAWRRAYDAYVHVYVACACT